MINDSFMEMPGIDRRHHRRRLLLIEVGVVALVALLFIFVLPAVLPSVRLNQMGRFLALAIAALGIDLIWGYTGLLSLGHGVFFALGGYALAMHLQLAPLKAAILPEFMNLYGVSEIPWFWKPFASFGFATVAV